MQHQHPRTHGSRLALAGLFLSTFTTFQAQAGSWGALVGYNNPAGSRVGLNFLYQGAPWGFEFGVGGLATTTDSSGEKSSAVTWGDIDIKYYPSTGLWRPFLEGGMAFALGAGSAGSGLSAGSPFAGGGLLYSGGTFLFHIGGDYKINERVAYPSAGFGFRL
jgi:hypothetical protein